MLNVRIPSNQRESVRIPAQDLALNIKEKRTGFNVSIKITVEDSPPFGGRGIPFYLSQFVSILGNLYPDRGVKGPFLGMFGKIHH